MVESAKVIKIITPPEIKVGDIMAFRDLFGVILEQETDPEGKVTSIFCFEGVIPVKATTGVKIEIGQSVWVDSTDLSKGVFGLNSMVASMSPRITLVGFAMSQVDPQLGQLAVYWKGTTMVNLQLSMPRGKLQ